jgi:phage gp36-like protein
MAYCTQSDIVEQLDEDILEQLTDDAGAGDVDDSVVDRAIADADAEVDAYCMGRYTVPLSPVPAMIRRISVDMAIYHLYSRRSDPPEVRKDRYKNAVRFLEKVSTGGITLGAAEPTVAGSNQPVRVSTDKDDRTFTMTKMSGF